MEFRFVVDRARTVAKTLAKHVYRRPFIWSAPVYRRLIWSTKFIGVTGSAGKTTTKDLVYEVLRSKFKAHKSHDTNNQLFTVARTIFEVRPGTAFCVQEVGVDGVGSLDRPVRLLAPAIAVVTNVQSDHCKAFPDGAAIATEKAKLVRALVPGGVAVLNADDPQVLDMAKLAPGKVLTFGTGPGAELRAEEVLPDWPHGFRFVLHHRGERYEGQTGLQGTHLIHCVLAAVATGLAAGMAIPECLQAVREFRPRLGRMSIHRTQSGITFVRDDWKAPLWSIAYPIEFMATVPARRKVLVLGTIADYRGSSYSRYRDTVNLALRYVDEVVMIGEHAGKAERIARQIPRGSVIGFPSVRAASDHLRQTLQLGDAVLLKGPNPAQHFARLALMFDRDVRCWRMRCAKDVFCDDCDLLSVPEG